MVAMASCSHWLVAEDSELDRRVRLRPAEFPQQDVLLPRLPAADHQAFVHDVDRPGVHGAHGIAADGHGFDDAVGVSLEDTAVHEGTGVAFVAVADDVLHGVTTNGLFVVCP